MAGISAVTSGFARNINARVTAQVGLAALIAGVATALVSLGVESGTLFLVAAGIAGLGFGPAFGGIFRMLTSLAPPDRRAELVSAVLAVSYIAFSVPAVVAGFAVVQIGLRETAIVYGATLIAVALLALSLAHRLDREVPTEAEFLVEA